MAIVYSYPIAQIEASDLLIGTKTVEVGEPTKSFLVSDFINLLATSGAAGPQGPEGPAGAEGPAGETGPQGIQGAAGPVGPAGLNWQGSWVSGTSYAADDAVGYGGASYFCILATSGTTNPSVDTTHWALLASQGALGPQGPTGATGVAGPTGPQGPQGVAGATGATGPQGPAGSLIPWLEYNATDLTVWNNGKGNLGQNTTFGEKALSSTTSGNYNTSMGYYALNSNQGGIQNVAIGMYTLQNNVNTSFNTAVGTNALRSQTGANRNVAIGNNSLYSNLIGSNNTAIGMESLYIGAGSNNVAVGYRSLYSVEGNSGIFNTAIGTLSGYNASTDSQGNVYIGYNSGPLASVTELGKLYIHNTGGTPLIGGDFNEGIVTINDILNLTPRVSAPSSPVDGMIAVYGVGAAQHIYCRLNGAWVQLD